MEDSFWEVLAEAWEQQIVMNETFMEALAGLQATDAALMRMVTRIDWTTIVLSVGVSGLVLDRLWQVLRRRMI